MDSVPSYPVGELTEEFAASLALEECFKAIIAASAWRRSSCTR